MKENNDGNDTNVGSMENSIKETIKIIERKIKEAEHYSDITGLYLTLDKELCNAFINILSDYKSYKRVLKENEELKEYIAITPNLDEMTATKYRNIQQYAYMQGRAEEQQKAEQIIYESYISKQTIKDKIEELSKTKGDLATHIAVSERIRVLQELLEESEDSKDGEG